MLEWEFDEIRRQFDDWLEEHDDEFGTKDYLMLLAAYEAGFRRALELQ